jgi:anti-sigma-K factor RskA
MNAAHVMDDIPAYVLGALSEKDRQHVEKHIAACTQCRNELLTYQQVQERLPEIAPQYIPPQRLRASILQKALNLRSESSPSFKERISVWLRPLASPQWGVVSLAVILLLGMSNLFFWQQTRTLFDTQSEFRLVQLAAEKSAANASGVIVMSGDGNFGTLIVDGLPDLGTARQYQLWLIKAGKRTSGGVFSVLDNGYGVLVVKSPQLLSVYDAFGVTIEPNGGSPAPTGNKVLGGKI